MTETINTKFGKLKFNQSEKVTKTCSIDGFSFEYPESFEEYLLLGCYGSLLILTLPLWIWFYAIGKTIRITATTNVNRQTCRQLICPVCNLPTIKGEYKRIICKNCGYYRYEKEDDNA